MPQSFACLPCHIVFSTKHRQPLITPELQPRLFEYVGGILRNHGMALLAAGGIPDHCHWLVSMSRDAAVADAVRLMKSNSTNWIHESIPGLSSFAWQTGYGAFNVSYSQMSSVKAYLARQEVHHRKQSYQEEFIALLKKHEVTFDEKYLWE